MMQLSLLDRKQALRVPAHKLYSQRPSDFSDVQSLWDCVYGYS